MKDHMLYLVLFLLATVTPACHTAHLELKKHCKSFLKGACSAGLGAVVGYTVGRTLGDKVTCTAAGTTIAIVADHMLAGRHNPDVARKAGYVCMMAVTTGILYHQSVALDESAIVKARWHVSNSRLDLEEYQNMQHHLNDTSRQQGYTEDDACELIVLSDLVSAQQEEHLQKEFATVTFGATISDDYVAKLANHISIQKRFQYTNHISRCVFIKKSKKHCVPVNNHVAQKIDEAIANLKKAQSLPESPSS